MENKAKQKIQALTAARIEVAGSQNKYAAQIDVAPATLTNLMRNNWELISEDMWQKLADACGYKEDAWVIADTRNVRDIKNLLHEAKTFSEVYAWISAEGSSKTVTCLEFKQQFSEVYLLRCEEHWTKKEFLQKLYRQMGKEPEGMTASALMDAIEEQALKATNPLIIMDELDKVNDGVLYFFISLYNRLQGKCGVFMCATSYLKKRIVDGIKRKKKGYAEFYSRLGRKFIEGKDITGTDINTICIANGLTDQKLIEEVIHGCEMDMRRVERMVKARLRKQGKGRKLDNPGENKEAA